MGLDTLHENLLRRAVVGDLITRSAERFGDTIALVCREQRISFKEVNERSCQAANAFLEMGIRRGDRVVFMTHNCLEYIYCRYGLSKIGAIMVYFADIDETTKSSAMVSAMNSTSRSDQCMSSEASALPPVMAVI